MVQNHCLRPAALSPEGRILTDDADASSQRTGLLSSTGCLGHSRARCPEAVDCRHLHPPPNGLQYLLQGLHDQLQLAHPCSHFKPKKTRRRRQQGRLQRNDTGLTVCVRRGTSQLRAGPHSSIALFPCQLLLPEAHSRTCNRVVLSTGTSCWSHTLSLHVRFIARGAVLSLLEGNIVDIKGQEVRTLDLIPHVPEKTMRLLPPRMALFVQVSVSPKASKQQVHGC